MFTTDLYRFGRMLKNHSSEQYEEVHCKKVDDLVMPVIPRSLSRTGILTLVYISNALMRK